MRIAAAYFRFILRLFDEKKYFWAFFFMYGMPQLLVFLVITILYFCGFW